MSSLLKWFYSSWVWAGILMGPVRLKRLAAKSADCWRWLPVGFLLLKFLWVVVGLTMCVPIFMGMDEPSGA